MKIGVMTGGGDCPGLNAAIRAVVRRGLADGHAVEGIRYGWAGLMGEPSTMPLTAREVSGIGHIGGTILGTSRVNPTTNEAAMDGILDNLKRTAIDALVVIGGNDTLAVAHAVSQHGYPVVGIPKTINNTVWGTDYCIGFNTAVTIVADVLDRLHTTASAHNHAIVLEVMGREAGWIAIEGGLAGGADYIVVPEVPTSVDRICAHAQNRRESGKTFSLVVVSEAATVEGIDCPAVTDRDEFGRIRFEKRNIGDLLAQHIEHCTGIETRAITLGRLQRGGSPTVLDRVMATKLGVEAVEFIEKGTYGVLAAVSGEEIHPVALQAVVGRERMADLSLHKLSELFY